MRFMECVPRKSPTPDSETKNAWRWRRRQQAITKAAERIIMQSYPQLVLEIKHVFYTCLCARSYLGMTTVTDIRKRKALRLPGAPPLLIRLMIQMPLVLLSERTPISETKYAPLRNKVGNSKAHAM